jgi:hypothetical protein
MHWARIFLFVPLLGVRAIGVNRPYLTVDAYRERKCADQNQGPFVHL